MSVFQGAIQVVLKHEGGFTDNPNDAGNWTGGQKGVGELKGTKFGISAKTYPDLDIKNLTLEDAIAIYKKDWWDKQGYGRILDQIIATKLFDTAVNMGAKTAHKCIQRALWAVNPLDGHGIIIDDGVLGTKSINAINSATPQSLLSAFRSECAAFYRVLVTVRPSDMQFFPGWIKRAYS